MLKGEYLLEAWETLPQGSCVWFSPGSLQVSLNSPPPPSHFTGHRAGCITDGSQRQHVLASVLRCSAGQILPGQQDKQPRKALAGVWDVFCPRRSAVVLTLCLLPLLGCLGASGNEGSFKLFAQSKRTNAGDSLESPPRGPPLHPVQKRDP